MTFSNYTPFTTPEKTAAKITNTPWGPPQTVEVIAHGIFSVSTASHGGFYLDPDRNAEVPDYFKASTFNRLGDSGWYEEDCDWCIPALVFPDEFAAKLGAHTVSYARQIACRAHTEAFDRFSPVRKAS